MENLPVFGWKGEGEAPAEPWYIQLGRSLALPLISDGSKLQRCLERWPRPPHRIGQRQLKTSAKTIPAPFSPVLRGEGLGMRGCEHWGQVRGVAEYFIPEQVFANLGR